MRAIGPHCGPSPCASPRSTGHARSQPSIAIGSPGVRPDQVWPVRTHPGRDSAGRPTRAPVPAGNAYHPDAVGRSEGWIGSGGRRSGRGPCSRSPLAARSPIPAWRRGPAPGRPQSEIGPASARQWPQRVSRCGAAERTAPTSTIERPPSDRTAHETAQRVAGWAGVAEVERGDEILPRALAVLPHVALLDIDLPGAKTGAANRIGAIRMARNAGWI
jgi:hypothetical protein